jgi:hypothetical protein
MKVNNVRKMVYELLGKQDDQAPLHIQTVKITEAAHAKLRALGDVTSRSKTPLAADLLMAAIDDAIEALPNEPLDEATSDKLRGVVQKMGVDPLAPYGMRDIVLERVEAYISHDEHERWQKQQAVVSVDASSNGVAH